MLCAVRTAGHRIAALAADDHRGTPLCVRAQADAVAALQRMRVAGSPAELGRFVDEAARGGERMSHTQLIDAMSGGEGLLPALQQSRQPEFAASQTGPGQLSALGTSSMALLRDRSVRLAAAWQTAP